MQRNHLPFPVANTSDLKRAIRYISRTSSTDDDAKRYIIGRARALGHSDLLPTSWTQMTTTQHEVTLDEQIEQLANRCDLSEAQLKTVYLRGVNDFFDSDISYGSATMYGLARVQRFINERGAVIDTDLLEVENEAVTADCGIELISGMFFSPDIVYASGKEVAALFSPGVVTALTIADDSLHVSGELGTLSWVYELNTLTGAATFTVS